MTVKLAAVLVLSLVVGGVVLGAGGAWWLRRRSTLTIRNVYAPAVVLTIGTVLAATQRSLAGAGAAGRADRGQRDRERRRSALATV